MGDDNYKTVTVSSSVPIIRMNKGGFLIFYESILSKNVTVETRGSLWYYKIITAREV
jgi:hypothetical protein